ncbi:MAG: hypothetical protein ACYC18_05260 [Gammaproteobacteria bacterium]|nr:hypothetical protein [Gammaproteobacteria bacterium]
MRRKQLAVALVTAAALTAGAAQAAQGTPSTTVGVQPSFFEGNFGTTSNVQIWYLPTYIKYRDRNAQLKLTIPYITVKSSGALVSGGTVIGKSGQGASQTSSGLGDIWLEGDYTLRGSGAMPDLVPYAKVKFGTASRSKGLGTGENDYEFGMGANAVLGTRLFPFAQVGYRVVGSPPNLALRNIVTYEAGGSLRVAEGQFFTLMYSGHQSEQAGFQPTSDALVAWNYDLRPGTGVQVFGDLGLSSGSPDYGVGLGAHVRF